METGEVRDVDFTPPQSPGPGKVLFAAELGIGRDGDVAQLILGEDPPVSDDEGLPALCIDDGEGCIAGDPLAHLAGGLWRSDAIPDLPPGGVVKGFKELRGAGKSGKHSQVGLASPEKVGDVFRYLLGLQPQAFRGLQVGGRRYIVSEFLPDISQVEGDDQG